MDKRPPPPRPTLRRPPAPAQPAAQPVAPPATGARTARLPNRATPAFQPPRRTNPPAAPAPSQRRDAPPAPSRSNVWRSDGASKPVADRLHAAERAALPASAPQATTRQAPARTPASARAAPVASASTESAPPNSATGTRLNKRMADLGLCSRREADEWIAKGWVFVNAAPALTGQRVQEADHIHVDKAAYGAQNQQVTILLHKPVGYVSGQPEDGHESAAMLISNASRWRGDRHPMRFLPRQLHGLAPAGRLDIDSTGLLVLTQDGRIARQLIGEASTIDKEYLVRVEYATAQGPVRENVQGVFPAEQLALLRHGLRLDEQPLRRAQVDWQNPEQLRFVLTEGKKRQIRRMCEAVGLKVIALKRVRIGHVMLGDLPQGQWRFLAAGEGF